MILKRIAFLANAGFLFAGNASAETLLDFDIDGHGNVISPGQIIDNEYSNLGVTISTVNNGGGPNVSMAFDSSSPTGGDTDLSTPFGSIPALDNILVIQESFNRIPDDEAGGGKITFSLATAQTFAEVGILDIEEGGGTLGFFLGNTSVGSIPILPIGDHSYQIQKFNGLFDRMEVNLVGSGAVGFVRLNVPEPSTYLMLGSVLALVALKKRKALV